MKNIVENDEGQGEKTKAWLDFVELFRELGQRRNIRVVGEYIARTPPSEDRAWALSPEEEEGLLAALASLRAGREEGVSRAALRLAAP
jgi:hypothetical protein